MQAAERLYITADKKRLVAEGDPAGAFLYAAPGDEIPDSAVDKFGLVDGKVFRTGAEKKRRDEGDDKSRKDGSDKDRKDGDNKDTQREGSSGTARKAPSTGSGTSAETSNVGVQPGSPQADDLTKIKGIGAKTAATLKAAEIDTFAKLAAIDPASPPEVDGLSASGKDWVSWQGQARILIVPVTEPAPGLTINTISQES
ncbi:hypothetical protein K1W69_17470 [Hoeflea sp. WL0058]|uniref:DUF4332 domain-containing protein n=1 Tax=Flavimaribacter sediminis TaxID=2865987 RepID=A0AAE3D0X1_9HYPH|nr:hypothetical protein [Flavimaribacter sediminis]MBW8638990.1 hypothetical protein [Flavimaribacter sediminis]